jgi:hypothetical protein
MWSIFAQPLPVLQIHRRKRCVFSAGDKVIAPVDAITAADERIVAAAS